MNPASSLWQSYLRWRHSHGFGVHSPFAYELVTSVVRPGKYGYYGYRDIDISLDAAGNFTARRRNDARLLLRLLVVMRSRRLIHSSTLSPETRAAAKAAGASCVSLRKCQDPGRPGDLLLSTGDIPSSTVGRFIDAGVHVLALDPPRELSSRFEAMTSNGIVFIGKRIILAVPRQLTATAVYSMRF